MIPDDHDPDDLFRFGVGLGFLIGAGIALLVAAIIRTF